MNDAQKEYLEKMNSEYKIEDTTDKIRQEQQSEKLKKDINKLFILKLKYSNKEDLKKVCDKNCEFLKNKQPKLYEKLIDDDSNRTIELTAKMITILEHIETGKIDQTMGSYQFGEVCKEIFIDPKLAEKNGDNEKEKNTIAPEKMSYKDFKDKQR